MNSMNKKVLLVTFSDNADHQDITFGMYEELKPQYDAWLMCIKTPRVGLKASEYTKMVDCPKRPGICKKTFDLSTLCGVIRWIRNEKFDVIFFETLHVWNLPIMFFRQKSTRIYQVIHDLLPHGGDKQAKSVALMNRAVCKLADTIVLYNQKYVDKVTELYGVPKNRVAYMDMWRRFPEFTEPKYTKKALFFGRINPYKGVDNLLEIVKKCPNVQFEVVGRVDPQMEGLVKELGEEKNVIMNNDYVSDQEMIHAFKNADWVILPYNSATQSGVVIDAYRYSRPVIVTDVGAISEQVEDGRSGYMIPAGDNMAFAEKLLSAVQMNDIEYKDLCRSSYEFGSKKYAATGAVERFMNLIS